jgi:hypothetical protein
MIMRSAAAARTTANKCSGMSAPAFLFKVQYLANFNDNKPGIRPFHQQLKIIVFFNFRA